MGNNGGGGMMGAGGGNGQSNNGGFFSEDDGDSVDAIAMLGVLASIKDGAGGVWDAYNGALAEKPILVKVRSYYYSCTSML